MFKMCILSSTPQLHRVGHNIFCNLIIITGASQGCVLSPFCCLYTHHCVATDSANSIFKFTVVGQISNNGEI